MAEDDMAVLLQTAISEMQELRRQAEALLKQNQQLVDQNNQLTDTVIAGGNQTTLQKASFHQSPSVCSDKSIESNLKVGWLVKWLNLG